MDINKNIQILANASQTAMSQIPYDDQVLTYTGTNPTKIEYYLAGVKVGQVDITYNGDNNVTRVKKVSWT